MIIIANNRVFFIAHMGVSKNGGTPKWMVKIMENPIFNGCFGGTTSFGNIQPYIVGIYWVYPLLKGFLVGNTHGCWGNPPLKRKHPTLYSGHLYWVYLLLKGFLVGKTHDCWGNPPCSETSTTWTSVIIFCIQKLSAEILLELFATSDPKPGRVTGKAANDSAWWLHSHYGFPWDESGIDTDPWMVDFYGKCIGIYTSPMDP